MEDPPPFCTVEEFSRKDEEKKGDPIEFEDDDAPRWAIFYKIVNAVCFVIHFSSIGNNNPIVKFDLLKKVAGGRKCRINKKYDKVFETRNSISIMARARSLLGRQDHDRKFNNSEQFVVWCRYEEILNGKCEIPFVTVGQLISSRQLQQGDPIEFKSGIFRSHWAIYTGDNKVLHFSSNEKLREVREESLKVAAKGQKCRIRKKWDDVLKVKPVQEIMETAYNMLGRHDYNADTSNSEHLVMRCRYKPCLPDKPVETAFLTMDQLICSGRLKIGDPIVILLPHHRPHWVIYVGNSVLRFGTVIPKVAHCVKGVVRCDSLRKVVGRKLCKISKSHDLKLEAKPTSEIVKTAKCLHRQGKRLIWDSEEFVTWCRYGFRKMRFAKRPWPQFLSRSSQESGENPWDTTEVTASRACPGDLIEFKDAVLRHWAIFTGFQKGKGMIIHLWKQGNQGYRVRCDSMESVANERSVRINNKHDKTLGKFDEKVILRRARAQLDNFGLHNLPYTAGSNNCEHFVTWCRNGYATSAQNKPWNFSKRINESPAEYLTMFLERFLLRIGGSSQ